MATLTLVNLGVDRMAKLFLNKGGSPGNNVAHLYVNNHAPAVADTDAAYTECSATGYASVTLTGASWSGSASLGIADYTYPSVTFTFSAGLGQTVYGVYMNAPGDADLMMAGLLDTPFAIPSGGGSLVVNLEFQEKQC